MAKKKTKLKVRSGEGPGSGSDVHEVKEMPEELEAKVNAAIRAGDRLVTVEVPKDKKLSVIAERIEAIWEE